MARTPAEIKKDIAMELRKALRVRNVLQKEVADDIGAARTSISTYAKGNRTPRHETALKLADVLMWPRIAELSVELHLHPCVICGRMTLDAGQQYKKKFCSKACHSTNASRVRKEKRVGVAGVRDAFYVRRLAVYQEVIEKHCTECTAAERLCRDDECILREVSPFPFVPLVKKKSA